MTAYQFVQPWLSKTGGDEASTAYEFANLRKYLKGLDDGTTSLFNLHLLNSTIDALTAGGNITMGGFKLTGLGAGSVNGDSLRYEQVIGLYLLLTGGTLSGNIAMGTNKVTGLGAAAANGDAVRYEQINGLRVLSVNKGTSTTTFTTTSSTYQTSNLAVTFTPVSTASTCLLFAAGPIVDNGTSFLDVYAQIFRGTTNTGAANGLIDSNAASGIRVPGAMFTTDAPATASAVTYSVKIRNDDNTTSISFGNNSVTQTIIAVEIG